MTNITLLIIKITLLMTNITLLIIKHFYLFHI